MKTENRVYSRQENNRMGVTEGRKAKALNVQNRKPGKSHYERMV